MVGGADIHPDKGETDTLTARKDRNATLQKKIKDFKTKREKEE